MGGGRATAPHPESLIRRGRVLPIVETLAALKTDAAKILTGKEIYVRGRLASYDGYEGTFIKSSTDYSAAVAVDTKEAVFIDLGGGEYLVRQFGQEIDSLPSLKDAWFDVAGDGVADDTAGLLAANTLAFYLGVGVRHQYTDYLVSGPITPQTAQTSGRCHITTDSVANFTIDAAASVFDYLWYFETAAKPDVKVSGRFIVDGNDRCATCFRASYAGATAQGSASVINAFEIKNFKKDSSITTGAAGIFIDGRYLSIYIKGNTVLNISRDNHASAGNTCNGIAATGFENLVDVSENLVGNITTPDVDADGIAVFGYNNGASLYRSGKGSVVRNQLTDCQGRAVKIQTSEGDVSFNTIRRESVVGITQSVDIDHQFGMGSVYANTHIYRKTGGGASPLGSSHSVYSFDNRLTNREKDSTVSGGRIFTEVEIPRVVLGIHDSGASTFDISGVRTIGIEDMASAGEHLSRAFFEIAVDDLHNDEYLQVRIRDCQTASASYPLVGYTGYSTGNDVSDNLRLDLRNNENLNTTATAIVSNISGDNITDINNLVIQSNREFRALFTNQTVDFNQLADGTEFGIDLSTATLTNGPATTSTATGYVRCGTTLFGGWAMQELFTSDGEYWYRMTGSTWTRLH